MSTRSRSAPPPEDDLRLPRLPGVVRRFWSRHPVLADVVIALLCLLLTLTPPTTFRGPDGTGPLHPTAVPLLVLTVVCSALLLRRRTWTLSVFVASYVLAIAFLFAPVPVGSVLPLVTSYSLAVYRSSRAAWLGLGLGIGSLSVVAGMLVLTSTIEFPIAVSTVIGEAALALIGTLVGVNVGNRKRYVEAIIDRSRQLLRERDQQGQIAAAAERARIAREMHDIVSHSLTVIVALTEGAGATADPERARQATLQASQTARAALQEMRGMLGVLRDESDPEAPLLPPDEDAASAAIDAARAAGFPVTSKITTLGAPLHDLPRTTRLAVGRVVQEGVTNAMRHAPAASTISVTVAVGVESVDVEVRNDGVTGVARPGGFGLRGLRERVELAGGQLAVGPEGAVWRLRASLPLAEEPTASKPAKGHS